MNAVSEITTRALSWDAILRKRWMPYWYETTLSLAGGYQLFDRGDGRVKMLNSCRRLISSLLGRRDDPTEQACLRQLISQARILWIFSLAHRLGYSRPGQNYLEAAQHGYSYLTGMMLDREHGGFYWKAHTARGVIQPQKVFCGQAYAIFALVEYHRASGLAEPLNHAISVYEKVQKEFHDQVHGGWFEHGERDFKLLSCIEAKSPGVPGVVGLKSGDGHLHWLEALTELYSTTKDSSVRDSLVEVLDLLRTKFFPPDTSRYCEYRLPNWEWIDDVRYAGLCHGHILEFDSLMLQAEKVLELPLSWDHFDDLLSHSLHHAFDHKRGGFYSRGFANQPALDTDKIWWVQAEGLAAMTDAAAHFDREDYYEALNLLLGWIFNYQVRSDDGIWIWSTDATGRPNNFTKAGEWKAGYHELRAITKFVQTFLSAVGI
jgi:cellobiose epimerase